MQYADAKRCVGAGHRWPSACVATLVLAVLACAQEHPAEPEVDAGLTSDAGADGGAATDASDPSDAAGEIDAAADADAPACVAEAVVIFGDDDFYADNMEPELLFWGHLIYDPTATPPPTRDFDFFLDAQNVYGGNADHTALLMAFHDADVLIRGKRTDLGVGPEIWPATICEAAR